MSIDVGTARWLGEKNHCKRVIIIYEDELGRIGGASWGKTKPICDKTGRILDSLCEVTEHELRK